MAIEYRYVEEPRFGFAPRATHARLRKFRRIKARRHPGRKNSKGESRGKGSFILGSAGGRLSDQSYAHSHPLVRFSQSLASPAPNLWRDIGPLSFSPPHPAYSRRQLFAKAARHRRLLRARRERPRRCAAEQRDELAALHSITSGAGEQG
jgi:hypothetical protein